MRDFSKDAVPERATRRHAENEAGAGGVGDFFASARGRLLDRPSASDELAAGDQVLNPHLRHLPMPGLRDAAVLIPVLDEGEPQVLLTQRTGHLPSHAGQIAFPGGKIDAGDAGPLEAALREAREEVGLEPESMEVLGFVDTYLSRTGYRIFPVVARVEADPLLKINPGEVEEAFRVPLNFLLDPANHRVATRVFGTETAQFYEIPYGKRYIWGVTAGILKTLHDRMVR